MIRGRALELGQAGRGGCRVGSDQLLRLEINLIHFSRGYVENTVSFQQHSIVPDRRQFRGRGPSKFWWRPFLKTRCCLVLPGEGQAYSR
jgi:hypothetical protein